MADGLQLGICTIGDLLLRSRVISNEEGKLIEGVELSIPEYQRPYKWTAKNANQLLDDIVEAMNANKEYYRVGTLILHNEGEVYCIVDGQQRIITFSLLLKTLDYEAIPFLNQELFNNSINVRNIINNSRSLKRRLLPIIADKNYDINRLKNYITDHCEMIVVITDDLSEAFQFFDSQNARGKALYPHDLLKAYHLREMRYLDEQSTEQIVNMWESLDQKKLSVLFNEYLYRLKEWVNGNRAVVLNEHNIDIFKGVTGKDTFPYAQYYKGAFSYADDINRSQLTFVAGIQDLCRFQLNAPIIAGKPFFEYAKHYYDILDDIQDNDVYEGYFIKGNKIVDTLEKSANRYNSGVGNRITRLMLDTAILLYVDRYCPSRPSKSDLEYLEQFVEFAFVWAYSMRAQYKNVGWSVAQNYILGTTSRDNVANSMNLYKAIVDSSSPKLLLNYLSDRIIPLDDRQIVASKKDWNTIVNKVPQNYLYYFDELGYWENRNEQ